MLHDLINSTRFPRYSYNSLSNTLSIQSVAGSIHEKAVSTVSTAFTLACDKLPIMDQDRIHIVTNQTFTNFQGDYRRSEKIPDAALEVETIEGKIELKFILEVGLAETYEMLVKDAKMWLEGTKTVTIVMLVKIEEEPAFKCPLRSSSEDGICEHEVDVQEEITEEMFSLAGPYGPAVYKGVSWVGTITGFIEIWTRDPDTHLAIPTKAPQVSCFLPS